jgi:MFS family permease
MHRHPLNLLFLVILAGSVVSLIGFGGRTIFGLFLEPITQSYEWERTVFALALALQNLFWGLSQPFAGALADRFGPVKVLAYGGVLYAVGVAAMSVTTSPVLFGLSAGVIVGLGMAGCSFTIVIAAVNKLVAEEHRSLASGLITAAGSLGQFLFAPAGQSLLAAYSWQSVLLLLALVILIVPAVTIAGLGRAQASTPSLASADFSFRDTAKSAFSFSGYRYLNLGFFVCGFHIGVMMTHLPAALADRGATPETAAWGLALIGLSNIVGASFFGWLGGKFSKRILLSLIYGGRGLLILAFISLPLSPNLIYGFAIGMGFLWLSTVPLTAGLVSVMFGPATMATLFGIVFFSHQVGAAVGAWLGGYFYAATGSYDFVWVLSIGLSFLAMVCHLPIPERRLLAQSAA